MCIWIVTYLLIPLLLLINRNWRFFLWLHLQISSDMDRLFKVCQLLAIFYFLIPDTVCQQPPADIANLDALIKDIFDIPSGPDTNPSDSNPVGPYDGTTIPSPYSGGPSSSDPQPTTQQYPSTYDAPQQQPEPTPQPQSQPPPPSQYPSTYEPTGTKPQEISPHVNPENEANVSVAINSNPCQLLRKTEF